VSTGPRATLAVVTRDDEVRVSVVDELRRRYEPDHAVLTCPSADDAGRLLAEAGARPVAAAFGGFGSFDPEGLADLCGLHAAHPGAVSVALVRWGAWDTAQPIFDALTVGALDLWLTAPTVHELADPQPPRIPDRPERQPAGLQRLPAGLGVRHAVPLHALGPPSHQRGRRSPADAQRRGGGDRPGRAGRDRRKLAADGRPALEALTGRGVFYGAAVSEAPTMRGRHVFVLGGGNSAGQAAVYLAEYADRVTVLVRRPTLGETMSDYLVRELEALPTIDVRYRVQVVGGTGSDFLESLVLRDLDTGEETTEPGVLFVLIGSEPRTDWLGGALARGRWGSCSPAPRCCPGTRPPPGRWSGRRRRPGRLGAAGRVRGRRGGAGHHPRARPPRRHPLRRRPRVAVAERPERAGSRTWTPSAAATSSSTSGTPAPPTGSPSSCCTASRRTPAPSTG
jgi:hypothetical protein